MSVKTSYYILTHDCYPGAVVVGALTRDLATKFADESGLRVKATSYYAKSVAMRYADNKAGGGAVEVLHKVLR